MYFDKLLSARIRSVNSCSLVFCLRLFAALIFLVALNVNAQMINTYTDAKQRAWIDTTSKEGSGNIRRIMELVNYKDKQAPRPGLEYSSMIYQYQFDCSKRTFKVLMSVAFEKHQGQGRQIFRDDTPTPSYAGVKDGTSIFEALAIACR